ncbi:MAG TPA: hypothetical protein PKW37_10140 [Salinivirgaceae bacterium]|nr:hypothetical protein [Salinivirgaceae bacterium]
MKNKYFIIAFLVLALFGCNSTLYQGGYSDELYFDGSVRESNTYRQKDDQDDRKIVSTDTYSTHNDDTEFATDEYYDGEYSGNAYISFSIAAPGFYAGINSPFWGGWYYPYYGPYARYRWIDWYWDAYFYSPYYAVYWNPYWYDPWYGPWYAGWYHPWYAPYYYHYWGYHYWGYHWAHWSYSSPDHIRETITHRNSLVTNRANGRGTNIRQGGTLKRDAATQDVSVVQGGNRPDNTRGGIRSTRPDNRLENDERNNQTIVRDVSQTTSDRDGSVVNNRTGNRNTDRGRITHTRETRPVTNDFSDNRTTPIRSNLGSGSSVRPSQGVNRPSNNNTHFSNPPADNNRTVPTQRGSIRPSQSTSNTNSEPRVIRPNTRNDYNYDKGRNSDSNRSGGSNSHFTPSRSNSNSSTVGGSRSSGGSNSSRSSGGNSSRPSGSNFRR